MRVDTTRRNFLKTMLGGVAAAVLGPKPLVRAGARSTNPLNFVFLLIDDFGWMDLGANNPHCFYDTPNLDRLARSAMNFTNGYAANPVCSPTRYSIMTGKYPSRVDATNWFCGKRSGRFNPAPLNDKMALEEVTLAEALKAHGYRTAFLGKWHLGGTEEYWPENQGFDVNVGGWAVGSPRGGYFAPFENPRLRDYPKGAHLPKILTDEAVNILDQYNDDRFLLYLAFYSVHTPLQGREDLIAKYKAKRQRWLAADEPEFGPEEQVWPVEKPRRVRLRQCHPTYAAMVEAMDEQIGRVLDKLEDLGIAENTAVFLMSDNGGLSTSEGSPTSNFPLRGGKGWLYEGGIREPFLIRWPGVAPAGSKCDVPVISTDFYPTILDMAGLPPRPGQHRDGISLVPLMKGGTRLDRDAIYWHYPHYANQGGFPGGAIRMGDWKLIERFEDGRVHLYNLRLDVGEREDLAFAYPERVAEMQAKLHTWYQEVDAKFLERKGDGPQPWRPL
ncbi:MAG: sulfatase [Phycisphaerales bacterium]|nr:MAG: sulfatase [Phycisphaerales bacterium]